MEVPWISTLSAIKPLADKPFCAENAPQRAVHQGPDVCPTSASSLPSHHKSSPHSLHAVLQVGKRKRRRPPVTRQTVRTVPRERALVLWEKR